MTQDNRALWASWFWQTAKGYITLLAFIWLPVGLHRVVMHRPGWWIFPTLFFFAGGGATGFLYVSHSPAWVFLIAPYVLVLAGDALSLWLWSWPFDWTPIGRLRELNAHYGASLHLSVGLVLAVVLWLLEAHHG
ncbi:hypothetical protein [Ralstonia pseudosolanacearum]|uniref:hypothetical protein n=1 Tax=Ralstonia pseudosolanacearum TaxID=1310165 RepID=UPI003C30124E